MIPGTQSSYRKRVRDKYQISKQNYFVMLCDPSLYFLFTEHTTKRQLCAVLGNAVKADESNSVLSWETQFFAQRR